MIHSSASVVAMNSISNGMYIGITYSEMGPTVKKNWSRKKLGSSTYSSVVVILTHHVFKTVRD